MQMNTKPAVHLWIYNHPFTGISDQVEFFVDVFRQKGYLVSVGRQPMDSALNIVIENFSPHTRDILIDYCRSKKKRVAVIMTEHIDFENGEIYIHGDPLWSDNDYMHPATQVARIRNLFDCLPYIRCLLVLGDLPELRGMSSMLPGVDVRLLPFPKLELITMRQEAASNVGADFLFTGVVTDYRANVLNMLKARDWRVTSPPRFVSRKARDALNRSVKLVLNIPQRDGWRWLSLMRIIAALRSGRATISLGTQDDSKIAAACTQLDIKQKYWMDALMEHLKNWQVLYRKDFDGYIAMAEEFENRHGFPHDLFEYWAITDRLPSPSLEGVQ